MTFIDWSDSEDMFGLLLDWVADEEADCREDAERRRFLSGLLAQLRAKGAQIVETSTAAMIESVRGIQESIDPAFESDPVMLHLQDFIEELERVEREAAQ